MSLLKEFREFAVKGNVVDMAVGIVIGAAFGKIVTSFVADVITPPIGLLVGGVGRVRVGLAELAEVEQGVLDRQPEIADAAGQFARFQDQAVAADRHLGILEAGRELAAAELPERAELLEGVAGGIEDVPQVLAQGAQADGGDEGF